MHSSELKVISLMKSSIEMLQNLPYFWNMKTRTSFHSIFRILLLSALINALFYALSILGLGHSLCHTSWILAVSEWLIGDMNNTNTFCHVIFFLTVQTSSKFVFLENHKISLKQSEIGHVCFYF